MSAPHTHGGTDAPECTTCTTQSNPPAEADLLAAIKWRLDHYGPLDAEPFQFSRYESPAHAALDAVQEYVAARVAEANSDRDHWEREYDDACAKYDALREAVLAPEPIDNFITDAMNRGIIPMNVAADLSQYLFEEWSL
jgi:hypothetical protein